MWTLIIHGPKRGEHVICAYLSGDHIAAEDLAQETFVEAWRNLDKLDDPSGIDRWLSAIARNVCLRWRSQRVKQAKHGFAIETHSTDLGQGLNNVQTDDIVEFDLERKELAKLLDQALDYLPNPTRRALLGRFVEESSYAEIAAQLQLSEGAVKMRVKRGRVTLARVLGEDLRSESDEFLPRHCSQPGRWETTNLWCSICGKQRLVGYFDTVKGDLALKCSTCFPTLGIHESQTYGAPAVFQQVENIEDAYSQLVTHAGNHFWTGLDKGYAPCTQCGRDAHVIRRLPDTGPLRTYD